MENKHIIEDFCPKCKGTGYIAGHDSPQTHGENGECLNCPIQFQCDECEGKGRVDFISVGKIV